ncbi:MAG: DUF3098 domain-containing protein [Bacteroidales bacterium]|jgi:uncharacterized membrane protein YphA (DoxX/SURF4 family)|nr:DUF3098 domain-containing protein [Bacteroidales bacterium]MDD2687393.1 DUF3098 domain-containing protein [Bacteroidales bacterium]MDD3329803.1 DUF3098 domain-containing protein [Bacteroidales bacterium]MDD3690586.1 DUF3098 domain-containing protein [Bacteroidales bacterium]MDD4044048.1 DUF3098 domain-containing protein [Bacteroidales bacterium]
MATTASGNKKLVKKQTKKGVPQKQQPVWALGMPFRKINYILMLAGILILIIGYYLLSGGGTDDPTEFSEAIFDTRRLYVAPIVLIIGFLVELVAIMYRPKVKEEENPTEKQ